MGDGRKNTRSYNYVLTVHKAKNLSKIYQKQKSLGSTPARTLSHRITARSIPAVPLPVTDWSGLHCLSAPETASKLSALHWWQKIKTFLGAAFSSQNRKCLPPHYETHFQARTKAGSFWQLQISPQESRGQQNLYCFLPCHPCVGPHSDDIVAQML